STPSTPQHSHHWRHTHTHTHTHTRTHAHKQTHIQQGTLNGLQTLETAGTCARTHTHTHTHRDLRRGHPIEVLNRVSADAEVSVICFFMGNLIGSESLGWNSKKQNRLTVP